MRRFLSSELRVWHLLLAVVVLATLSGGFVLARSPSPLDHRAPEVAPVRPASFFGAGDMRMAAVSRSDTVTVTGGAGEVELLHATFSVPRGHHEDIAAFFNGAAIKGDSGYCYLEFHLDTIGSTPMSPGELWVVDGNVYKNAFPTISAQGFRTNVGPGTHRLYVTLQATYSDCLVSARSLIVIANRR